MQPPGRPRLCAASGVRERQTPGRRRTPRVPAHEPPQLRNSTTPRLAELHKRAYHSSVWLLLASVTAADPHMLEHRLAAKVPTIGCCSTRPSCAVSTTPPAAKLFKRACKNIVYYV